MIKFIFILFLFKNIFSYKILVFSPTVSASHMILDARVADTLAKGGHDVTLLQIEFNLPFDSLKNITKYAKIKQIGSFTSTIDDQIFKDISNMAFQTITPIFILRLFIPYIKEANKKCEMLITERKEEIEKLRSEKYDVIITEQLFHCGSALAPLLDIRTHILLVSQPIPEHTASVLGLPYPTSYVPGLTLSGYSDKMSISERFFNLFFQMAGYYLSFEVYDSLTLIMRKHFGSNYPDIRQIIKDSPLILVNADEFVDFPRPLFSNIIYIGGIGMNEKIEESLNKLDDQLNFEMKKGKKGVVLFSFGTSMSTNELPKIFIQNLFKTFKEFSNYHFIVKVDITDNFIKEFATDIKNIFTINWIPQTKILNHPRLKLFITHCGYNSLLEAGTAGVPVLVIPFFFDQFRNARVAERNGWGLYFDKRLLLKSDEEFKIALQKILENER
nr:unnamed protein product [Meloidogyne enterolobii]